MSGAIRRNDLNGPAAEPTAKELEDFRDAIIGWLVDVAVGADNDEE